MRNYYREILSDKQEILLSANLWIPAEFGRYWELDLLLESWPVWVGLKCFLFSGIYIVYYTKKDTKEQFINHEKRDAFENPSVKVSNCEIECDELLWIRSSWGENFEDMPWISAPKKGFWTETRKDEAFVTRWTFETLERCDNGFKRNLTSSWWSAWRPPAPPCCCWWAPWCWWWWRVARGGESSWSASRGSSPTSTPTRWDENLRETIKSLHFETTTVSPLITVHWVYRCGFYNHQRLSHLSFDWVSYHSPHPPVPTPCVNSTFTGTSFADRGQITF